jgi:hypothetical protein
MSSPLDKKNRKSSKSFKCECCDYITSRKSNWLKHLYTKKHLKNLDPQNNENLTKKGGKFWCELCDYTTSRRENCIRHHKTKKCLRQVGLRFQAESIKPTFTCEWCKRSWGARVSLWRHKKKCAVKKLSEIINPDIIFFDKEEGLIYPIQNILN